MESRRSFRLIPVRQYALNHSGIASRPHRRSRLLIFLYSCTSLLYVINNKCNDTIGDLDVEVFSGKDHIFEEMEGLRFKVGPKSFYQTNSEQAYNLYKVAREFAVPTSLIETLSNA
jgi:hypothetical protein